MDHLPKKTPQMTQPIEHFIVRLKDGRVFKIVVEEGEGYFKEESFVGQYESFTMYQAFIAKGRIEEISGFQRTNRRPTEIH